jgi:hypothetical protein
MKAKDIREAVAESGRLVALSRTGGQWTVIHHPLPSDEERCTTGGQLSWPWPQACGYRQLARAEVALRLLGVDESSATYAVEGASQRGPGNINDLVHGALRIAERQPTREE